MSTKNKKPAHRDGAILAIVLIMMVVLTILILSLFNLGFHSARETDYELKSAQAFWLAEAGRQSCVSDLYAGGDGVIDPTVISAKIPGTFEVITDPDDSNARIAIGAVTVGAAPVKRRIRVSLAFVARPYENAIYAGNADKVAWSFQLRGKGDLGPVLPQKNQHKYGGRDSILGDIDINGNVLMYEDSSVNVPSPNRYDLTGDVTASETIYQAANATISGTKEQFASGGSSPDLAAMDYAKNNDYDIAKIFNDAGVSSGRLPSDHPLYDILMVAKNPPDRGPENASTPGDDFYFEPVSVNNAGNVASAVTPLPLGDDKVYYVDGHVWFHGNSTYGYKVDGQAAIVSTRDIHISDNLAYADRGLNGDLLALVALGQYSGDVLTDGGNIYFGDPKYGTLYTADAFMFANNNFYYNTEARNQQSAEPESGFKVFGNFVALNQVVVLRDWYPDGNGDYMPIKYDPAAGQWIEALTGDPIADYDDTERRHYAMEVGYDDRIRDAATQMSGLPGGNGTIFKGVVGWEEIGAQ